ncbi:hypothetical protein E4T45_09503 [Aureobasidium sp. EXF-8846]|nr:hypothetical protein E4T45_09503 [Aureobasidium sp. EXF-8846]
MQAVANLYTAEYTASTPVRRHFRFAILEDPDPGPKTQSHDTLLVKAVYSGLTGRRVKDVHLQDIRSISWIRFLVYFSYIISIAFFITSIAITVFGIQTATFCQVAIYFCIGFLVAGRVTIQLFLVERAHIANLDYLRRRDDPMWRITTALLALFAIFLTTWACLNPVAYIANKDGLCRKGIPAEVVAPLEVYEFVSNTLLTGVFVVMLRRTRRCELFPSVPERFTIFGNAIKSHIFKSSTPRQDTDVEMVEIGPVSATVILPPSTQPCNLRGLVFRSLIGTLLILG